MTEIIVLQKKEIDIMFGEHENVWVNVGWTDDITFAREWKREEHQGQRRQFEELKQMK